MSATMVLSAALSDRLDAAVPWRRAVAAVVVVALALPGHLAASNPVAAAAAEPSSTQTCADEAREAWSLANQLAGFDEPEEWVSGYLPVADFMRCRDQAGGAESDLTLSVMLAEVDDRTEMDIDSTQLEDRLHALAVLLDAQRGDMAEYAGLTLSQQAALAVKLEAIGDAARDAETAAADVGWPAMPSIAVLGGIANATYGVAAELLGQQDPTDPTDLQRVADSRFSILVATTEALVAAEESYRGLLSRAEIGRRGSVWLDFDTQQVNFKVEAAARAPGGYMFLHEIWTGSTPGNDGEEYLEKKASLFTQAYDAHAEYRSAVAGAVVAADVGSSLNFARQPSFLVNNRKLPGQPARCLDAAGTTVGTQPRMLVCRFDVNADPAAATQLWQYLPGTDLLQNVSSGLCLDLAALGPSGFDGLATRLADCDERPDSNQRWGLHPAGYLMTRAFSGDSKVYCLDPSGEGSHAALAPCELDRSSGVGGADAPIGIAEDDPWTDQLWHLKRAGFITVDTAGSGQGVVTSSPGMIDCSSAGGGADVCAAPYTIGLELRATALEGSVFTGWDGGASPLGCYASVCSVGGRGVAWPFLAQTATATFEPAQGVTVSALGQGSVASSPSGITCGTTQNQCSAEFVEGTQVELTAQPADGWVFTGWSGECSDTRATTGRHTCELTADEATGVTASFAPLVDVTVEKAGSGTGVVTSTPGTIGPISCASACTSATEQFVGGDVVTLTAEPGPGNLFVRWAGDCAGTERTCRFTPTADATVTAEYAPSSAVTITRGGAGHGTLTTNQSGIACEGDGCTGDVLEGTTVIVTAQPADGSVFDGWPEDRCDYIDQPLLGEGPTSCWLTVGEDDRTLNVAFAPAVDVRVAVDGNGTIYSHPTALLCSAQSPDAPGCTAGFRNGSTITLVASGRDDTMHVDWSSEACDDRSNRCTLSAEEAADAGPIVATFVPGGSVGVLLPPDETGGGGGLVTSSPSGLHCNVAPDSDDPFGSCFIAYPQGREITIRAQADPDSVFLGWYDFCGEFEGQGSICAGDYAIAPACPGSRTTACTVQVGPIRHPLLPLSVLAVPIFVPSDQAPRTSLEVTVTGSGTGSVASSPAGIDCAEPAGGACTAEFVDGETVTLTAAPAADSEFQRWTGPCAEPTNQECSLVVEGVEPLQVQASFARRILNQQRPTITGAPYVGERVTADPGDWDPLEAELSYQWLRDGEPIAGATEGSYLLVEDDLHAIVTVVVTASLSGYVDGVAAAQPLARINFAPRDPTAHLTALSTTPHRGATLQFVLVGSDPDGDVASWHLDFGDGSAAASGTGQPPSTVGHIYERTGEVSAMLTVTDSTGLAAQATVVLTVVEPPLDLTCVGTPAQFLSLLRAGRMVSATGIASTRYAGTSVSIIRSSTRTVVATAQVGGDGTFEVTWRRSQREIRENPHYSLMLSDGKRAERIRARYRLRIVDDRVTKKHRIVTIQVPRVRRQTPPNLLVRTRTSCTRYATIATVKIPSDRMLTLRLPRARPGKPMPIYRLTVVRWFNIRILG